jgi:hypothetical protein
MILHFMLVITQVRLCVKNKVNCTNQFLAKLFAQGCKIQFLKPLRI